MEANFQLGYREGDKVFYVSQSNNLEEDMDVTPKIEHGQDAHQKERNMEFEKFLKVDVDLCKFA